MSVLVRRALLRRAGFRAPLRRTITIGTYGPTTYGYSNTGGAPPGAISNNQFKGETIRTLFMVFDEGGTSNFFRIIFDADVPAGFFDRLRVETGVAGGGQIITLLGANAIRQLQGGDTFFTWQGDNAPPVPVYVADDLGRVLRWDIL